MLPEKYIELGFEVTKFGAHSLALRFNHKPLFIFSSDSNIDAKFLIVICDAKLNMSKRTKSPTCIEV
jgi:hypothetical protein